jgi:ABC-type Fe3+/spermidine/putrescine transport system ATPase subunit
VRPEELQLERQGDSTVADNTVRLQVVSSVYMGTYRQVQLAVADKLWLAQTPADLDVQPGDKVAVRLPASRIWVLPP